MLNLILCVDDDPITLMLCKMIVNKSSFAKKIITAQNGEEAINYFDDLKLNNLGSEINEYPELILLDLNMPVMNGWEFLDIFSKENYTSFFKKTKVIILSSTIDPEDIQKSEKYPMVINFISKPITTEILNELNI
jgi:CheY-like chemotaxis protein